MRIDKDYSKCGNYQILGTLGYGSLSIVYKAKNDRFPGQELALKVYNLLNPISQSKLLLKIENACSLARKLGSDDSFPRFFEFGKFIDDKPYPEQLNETFDVKPYLAMEQIPGQNLKELIKKKSGFSFEEQIFRMFFYSLAYEKMHRKMVIHGDVKMANLMFREGGSPVILDFDCSFEGAYQESEGRKVIMSPKEKNDRGTLIYQPPELVDLSLGNGHTQFSDVWGLGVIFYRLISGRLPFLLHSVDGLKQVILNAECSSLTKDNVDPAISELVHWCLTKEWYKRPDSTQLREGLEEIMREKGIEIKTS